MVNPSKKRKRGNKAGFLFFDLSLRIFGLRGTYGFLYFICLYYLIFDKQAFLNTICYVNKRYSGSGRLKKIFYVYLIYINQGKTLIDRYYVLSGLGTFEVELRGDDLLNNVINDQEKGLVILTAHVGNWQLNITALETLKKTVYLLMRPEENKAVKDFLEVDGEKKKIKIVSPDKNFGGVIELTGALNQGNIVSVMGDRAHGFETIEVDFLGEKAFFPFGAFSMSAAVGCPVVVLTSAKASTHKYIVTYANYQEPKFTSRKNKKEDIQRWVQSYADLLQDFVAQYPLQWFVFYDIWSNPT